MKLTNRPKPNHLRACITIHTRPHSKDVAVSYTDAQQIIHRTPWCRNRAAAEIRLRHWFNRTTGIGFVTLLATASALEVRKNEAQP
jgi:hypothetical protein